MRFLRNSFLFLLSLLPSFVFSSEGRCWIEQSGPDFTIVCEGSGIQVETVEQVVYTYGNCVSLKDSFLSTVSSVQTDIQNLDESLSSLLYRVQNIESDLHVLESEGKVSSSDLSQVYYEINTFYSLFNNQIESDKTQLYNHLNQLISQVSDINCSTSCPTNNSSGGSGDGTCCNIDFSPLLEKLNEAQDTREKIQQDIETSKSVLSAISNTVSYVSFLLEHGFGSTTNELAQINQFLSSVTNLTSSAMVDWYTKFRISSVNIPTLRTSLRLNSEGKEVRLSYNVSPFTSYSNPSLNYFQSLFAQGFVTSDSLISLNNYFSYFNKSFVSFTNEFSSFQLAATNHFSFFKKQLSELPVLADYDTYVMNEGGPDKYSYYDFLTNHYIQVAVGGTLSGNLQSKTNWFSRIETLLAALVFSDSLNVSNSVDVSSAESYAGQITQGLGSINTSASEHSQVLEVASQGIIQVFTSYCDIFSDAALPSQVTLVSFSFDTDDTHDISFGLSANPEFRLAIDYMRFVTTFCWSAAGIFALWKFLVWASRGFYLACKFIYIVITKTFK